MPITSAASQSTPAAALRRAHLAHTIFSFPVMCMFLLAAVIFGFCVKQFAEPDIWWHIRNAQYLVQHASFPNLDTYSLTAAGSLRPNYEWLSEIPFWLGFEAGGLRGILAVYFAALVLIYSGVYYRTCREGADCKSAVITTLLAISLGVISIGPRVLLFGWLCMVALLLLLDRFQEAGRSAWLIPPLFVIWVNLHASWIFGIAVLVLVFCSGLFEGQWGKVVARRWAPAQRRQFLAVAGASVAALFVNPFGYRLVFYPFDFLLRQQNNMQFIAEWQPVNFSDGTGKLVLLVIFALLATALFSLRPWRLDAVLLGAFALWAGLSHVRLLFFTGLIVPTLFAPDLKLFPPYDRELDKPRLNAAIMAMVAAAVVLLFPSSAKLQKQVDGIYPTSALHFMQQNRLGGRIFNQYVWGGYMEWKTPEIKPFIDGRADIFVYNGVFDDYFRAVLIQQPLEVLDKYRIDYALLQPDQPLTYVLAHSRAWHTIYSDPVAVLLARTTPTGTVVSPSPNIN